MDVRKTVTDAGYIAIGLGVMGAQRAAARAAALRAQLDSTSECLAGRGKEFETRAREAVGRVQELGSEVTARFEPLVEQFQARVAQLPEQVVQAVEPVTALVRERLGTAAA